MSLPLLEKVKEDGVTYLLTPLTARRDTPRPSERLYEIAPIAPLPSAARIPQRSPGPGEQYRFHFDMTACVGCKCCVVACNEQNGNPADINWRRVGEIEGGMVSRHAASSPFHGMQPLSGTFLSSRLSRGRIQERSSKRGCAA